MITRCTTCSTGGITLGCAASRGEHGGDVGLILRWAGVEHPRPGGGRFNVRIAGGAGRGGAVVGSVAGTLRPYAGLGGPGAPELERVLADPSLRELNVIQLHRQ